MSGDADQCAPEESSGAMETEEPLTVAQDPGLAEGEGVDLKQMADDYAKYLIVNSKQDQTTLDDKIDGVHTRVDEFKQQLYFLHQNIASNSNKTQELQNNTEQLLALFNKIDQMEAFLNMVGRNVDLLEGAISQAEKDLEPSKIRKVFSSLPGLGRKSAPKPDPTSNWHPPKVFKSRDFFPHGSNTASPSPSLASSFTGSGHPDEQLHSQQAEQGVTGHSKLDSAAPS